MISVSRPESVPVEKQLVPPSAQARSNRSKTSAQAVLGLMSGPRDVVTTFYPEESRRSTSSMDALSRPLVAGR